MHYSMHILSVSLDFKMKKHLLSTGSQNSIITITIEENAMEELVWINKLLPRVYINFGRLPGPDDGDGNNSTSFRTHEGVAPVCFPVLRKQFTFQSCVAINVHSECHLVRLL